MIGLPLRSAPRVLPHGRDDARLVAPCLVALMVCVAGFAGIGLLIIDDTKRAAGVLLSGNLTIQVPVDTSAPRLQTMLAVLRQTSGVRSVNLLTPAETGRLLEPWLGPPMSGDELPVPRLIDVGLDPGSSINRETLKQQLAAVVPEVRIDDHRPYLAGLDAGVQPLQGLLGAAIGAALLLTAMLAAFATRAALAARQADVELLHVLGASDSDIARPYAMRSLRHGLIGSGLGAAAIVAAIALLSGGGLVRLAAPVAIGLTDWRLWTILAAVTAATCIIAAASVWAAVLRRLARLP